MFLIWIFLIFCLLIWQSLSNKKLIILDLMKYHTEPENHSVEVGNVKCLHSLAICY